MRLLAVLASLVLLLPPLPSAIAQANDSAPSRLAEWIGKENEGAWWVLLAFGLLGVAAALLPVVGGLFPGTPGATRLKKREEELSLLEARHDALTQDDAPSPDAPELFQDIQSRRGELTSERWRVFLAGSGLYAVAGLVTAVFLAEDWLEAAAYGFGGPAVVGAIVAAVETRRKQEEKNEALEAALEALGAPPEAPLKGSPNAKRPVRTGRDDAPQAQQPSPSLIRKLRVARRL